MRRSAAAAMLCAAALGCALSPAPAQARTEVVTRHSDAFRLAGFKTIFPRVVVRAPRRAGYITRMDAWLVDGRGRRVTIRDVMLHHIVFLNRGERGGPARGSSCPGRGAEPFWGTGEEKQPLLLPKGYGYAIARRDRWFMQAMLMSHDRKPHVVRVAYRMHVVTGERRQRVKPLWLRANGCATHPSYDIEGGKRIETIHTRAHNWRMPFSGRIVAASAHLHGSSFGMTITQPRCAGRTLIEHQPRYGGPDDLVYRARPVLHEPGPIATGHFLSRTGIPVREGELLRVSGRYDATRPHPRVMAISHVYVAPDRRASRTCDPPPADARIFWTRKDGTTTPPVIELPLNGIGPDGKVRVIDRPPGRELVVSAPRAVVKMAGSRFSPANVSVASGTRVTWRFDDDAVHNVTLISGPDLVATPNWGLGHSYSKTLRSVGTYKLFCYLHPVTMTQVVVVRAPAA